MDLSTKVEPSTPSPLLAYKDRLLPLFESSVMASNEYNGLRLSALKGLELMALSKNFLDDNEVKLENIGCRPPPEKSSLYII